ncbi:MAG: 6-bladed beta-propeller [Bacteroidota bacterium]|nr:6-bladed beta-propeller [Bacteroidota bacterium]
MLHIFRIVFLVVIFVSCGVNRNDSSITEIYLADGEKNIKEFNLSELVDEVEYIKLETRTDCIITRPRFEVSENYLLISNQYRPGQVMLFGRDGFFKALIGKKGKGPTEYVRNSSRTRISNNEDWILVDDDASQRLLKYDITGKFLKSYSYKRSKSERMSKFDITPDNCIILLYTRPQEAVSDFPLVLILDEDFSIIEESFFITKSESTNSGTIAGTPSLLVRDNQVLIREPYFDTLYRKNGLKYEALFHINYKDEMPPNYHISFDKKYNQLTWISQIGDYIVGHAVDKDSDGRISTYYYNILTKETIHPKTDNSFNDIDGIAEVWISVENIEGYIIDHLQIIDLKEIIEKEEYKKSVQFPEKQKQLIKLADESNEEDNAIIRLFHVKSK